MNKLDAHKYLTNFLSKYENVKVIQNPENRTRDKVPELAYCVDLL